LDWWRWYSHLAPNDDRACWVKSSRYCTRSGVSWIAGKCYQLRDWRAWEGKNNAGVWGGGVDKSSETTARYSDQNTSHPNTHKRAFLLSPRFAHARGYHPMRDSHSHLSRGPFQA
jgi:hypothetical protein